MRPARALLLAAIRGYRRHLSPRKGFACAYRVHAGCASCSSLGLRAISRYGAWRGLGVLRLRLEQCRLVAEERRARRFTLVAQAGFIDCDVPCDASCVDGSACDACAWTGTGDWDCDWFGSRRSASAPVRRRRRRGEPVPAESDDEPAAAE